MEINCQFKITSSSDAVSYYTCFVEDANIITEDHEIKEFKGDHKDGHCRNDVKCVYFFQTKVNYFPRGLEKHFPNLIHLIIIGCGLKEISRNDLKGLEGLIRLQVENCELTSLPNDLFTEMPNLRTVSFVENKIEFKSSKFLKPLLGRRNVKQEEVDLRGNKNIDAHFKLGWVGSLKSLKELMVLINKKCKPSVDPGLSAGVSFEQPRIKKINQAKVKLNEAGKPQFEASKITELLLKIQTEQCEPKVTPKKTRKVTRKVNYSGDRSESGSDSENDLFVELRSVKCIRPAKRTVNPHQLDFNPKLKEMWISGRFSDLTIVAGDKEFKVHKAVLGMQSEKFAKIIEDQSEATEIKIPGYSSGSVEALLKFIYTSEASEDINAKAIIRIAHKFKVAEMKSVYEKIIGDQINEENAWELFLFAHRFSLQILKVKSFQQIVKIFPEQVSTELMDDRKQLKSMVAALRV